MNMGMSFAVHDDSLGLRSRVGCKGLPLEDRTSAGTDKRIQMCTGGIVSKAAREAENALTRFLVRPIGNGVISHDVGVHSQDFRPHIERSVILAIEWVRLYAERTAWLLTRNKAQPSSMSQSCSSHSLPMSAQVHQITELCLPDRDVVET
jgi:hypothetical protein